MKEAATINFEDLETKHDALATVRYDDSCVTIALSHRDDGDIQVVMNKKHAGQLRDALNVALK